MKMQNKILLGLLGAGVGTLISNSVSQNPEEKKRYAINGMWVGGLGTLFIIFLMEQRQNTLNYILKHNGIRVYDGITNQSRLNKRIYEHQASGKVFNEVVCDLAKPRIDALTLEKYRITRYKPKYNVQHNS